MVPKCACFGLLSDPSGRAMGLDVIKDKILFQNLTLLGLWFVGPYARAAVVLVNINEKKRNGVLPKLGEAKIIDKKKGLENVYLVFPLEVGF